MVRISFFDAQLPFILVILVSVICYFQRSSAYVHNTPLLHRSLLATRLSNSHTIHRYQQLSSSLQRRSTYLRASDVADTISADGDSKEKDIGTQLAEKLRGTCVYFVGMMGSGKSTVGDAFAKMVGYRFLDTDDIAEFMIEMPIADFFAQANEQQFRDLEYQILMEMAQYTRVVISTGGGIVLKNENWGLLRHGIVVFLDLSPEVIVQRMQADPTQVEKRPLLKESDPLQTLQQLCEERKDKYGMADVHVKVPAEASPAAVAELVCHSILDTMQNNPPLWRSWKAEKDKRAVQMASVANPAAIAADEEVLKLAKEVLPTPGSSQAEEHSSNPNKKGSIQYVSLSDIESGKVQLPNTNINIKNSSSSSSTNDDDSDASAIQPPSSD